MAVLEEVVMLVEVVMLEEAVLLDKLKRLLIRI
jgi:hypothetical protein